MKTIFLFATLAVMAVTCHAQVAFDAATTIDGFSNVTTITTNSFTIGSGSNRLAILGLTGVGGDPGAATAISCGGVSGSEIASTNACNTSCTRMGLVKNPPSGSQTCTWSWTTAQEPSLGVITVSGADQTTSVQNAVTNTGCAFGTSCSTTVNTANNHMTITLGVDTNADATQTSNQTRKTSDFGSMDICTTCGGASITHTWSDGATSTNWVVAGIDVINSGTTVCIQTRTTLGVGC